MRLEEVERVCVLVVQLDLELDRVGLEVDEAPGRVVLRPRLGAAVEVDDQLGRRVQAAQLAPRSSRSSRPSSCSAWYAQRPPRPNRRMTSSMNAAAERAAVVGLVAHQHRRRPSVRLDVVRIEAEPLEADEVVDRLPDDAGHRDLRHHPEHDDLRPRSSLRLLQRRPEPGRHVARGQRPPTHLRVVQLPVEAVAARAAPRAFPARRPGRGR